MHRHTYKLGIDGTVLTRRVHYTSGAQTHVSLQCTQCDKGKHFRIKGAFSNTEVQGHPLTTFDWCWPKPRLAPSRPAPTREQLDLERAARILNCVEEGDTAWAYAVFDEYDTYFPDEER